MAEYPVLIDGKWRPAKAASTFQAVNPATGERLPGTYPVSTWDDCDAALSAAAAAFNELRRTPPESIARFLVRFAERLEARKAQLVEQANLETALPASPRLADVELPRTTGQLRQAADAALEGSWALPTIDTKNQIRSCFEPIGPVVVFGPNNFPFAFNGAAGGDFAAAIATGNPVIAKGHPLHPGTSRMLAEEAFAASTECGLPAATVQLIYKIDHQSGQRLVSDPRVGASAFTGSRTGGLALKTAADRVGKPIYLEMSSINPVIMLPGALAERGGKVAADFSSSSLLGGGQFCTSPGLVLLFAGDTAEQFIDDVRKAFESAPTPALLSSAVAKGLSESVTTLRGAGAALATADAPAAPGCRYPNTLLRVSGQAFLERPEQLQTEAFGSTALCVVVRDAGEAEAVLSHLEGNLTGGIYSDTGGRDEALYARLEPILRQKVGRLLNDKMPTGVAVSPAMNHGGPFPATGHPGFTAVGIPASLRRFAMLCCYDNVREHRLPPALRDETPNGRMWRVIDGRFTQASCIPTPT
ncbi:MAG: aldehyde dehydrogenase family protein [Acidobacteria bacterium]|nr:MAG: aldehyde dehydrogenase family protein [Acidobacteriota bacterium]